MPIRLIHVGLLRCLSDKLIISVWHIDTDRWEEVIPLPFELRTPLRDDDWSANPHGVIGRLVVLRRSADTELLRQ
jgi:hypothetical protein